MAVGAGGLPTTISSQGERVGKRERKREGRERCYMRESGEAEEPYSPFTSSATWHLISSSPPIP